MIEKHKLGPIYQWYDRTKREKSFIFLIIGVLIGLSFLLPLVFFTKKVSMVFIGVTLFIVCFLWLFVLKEQLQYRVAYWGTSNRFHSLSKIQHPKTWWFFILIQVAGLIFGVILALWLQLY